tara:strand:- start:4085 stop:4981 length:897 start_codon:yes stop_codon:yes gene_type:complete
MVSKLTIDEQISIIDEQIKQLEKDKEKLINIKNNLCLICCNTIDYNYKFNCCDKIICSKCILEHIKNILNDYQFKIIKCPFCIKIIMYNDVKKVCQKNKLLELSNTYKSNILSFVNKTSELNKLDKLLNKKKIYGKCLDCDKLVSIKKECANSEGDLIVLKKEMFICQKHINLKLKTKAYEDLPFKKCPHCGILGKPEPGKCNFLYCNGPNGTSETHHWCYICQARLPGNKFGHNHHFWTGRGSSAFDFKCRVTEDIDNQHVLNNCGCSFCVKRDFKGICINENCDNITDKFKCIECS